MKWIRKIKQLFHIDGFKEIIIEKHIRDVEQTNVSLLIDSEREQDINCGDFDDEIECLRVIKPILLTKSLSNKADFVTINYFVRVEFKHI